MLWYSTPWAATPFSNDPLWLTLFVEGVNDRLLDHCQVSGVPDYCGFKKQEILKMSTVWMVIYWNSNVNILIFWDTVFWLSLSSNHQKKKKKLLKCFTLHVMNLIYMKVSLFFLNKLQEQINFFTIFWDVPVLKQSMIPSLRKLGRRAVFQHDNDHCLAKEAEGKGDGLDKHVSRPKPLSICGASLNWRWRSARSLTSTSSVMLSWRSERGL